MSPEWIAAGAAIWAAFATTWVVIVTRKAPVDAAKLAASLQDVSERRRQKLFVFATVMQNRHSLAELECVKALNLIDTVFHDAQPVRDAWAGLYAALNDLRNFPPTGPTPVIDERKVALLAAMARELGLIDDFRPDDFSRVYLPNSILSEMQVRDLQRRAALNALSGQPPAATLTQTPAPPVVFPPPPPKTN